MIIYYLVQIFIGLAALILYPITLLPDASLPPDLVAAISTIGAALHTIWLIMPGTVITLLAILVLVVGIETKIFSYKVIKWIYNKIPGVS
jgi:hypothetical protein